MRQDQDNLSGGGPVDGAYRPSDALVQTVKALLRPVVRLLIARGVTLPQLRQTLKEVYVESAEQDFALQGEEVTDSRVAMLTGVHRKDVREIRAAGKAPTPRSAGAPLAAAVISRWLGDPTYRDENGPRALPATAIAGPSFQSLVEGLSKDVRPRTVQAELTRLGVVSLDDAHDPPLLSLVSEALVPPGRSEEAYAWFAANAGDHLRATVANLLRAPGDPAMLERAVYHGGLSDDDVDALEAMAREDSRASLSKLNAAAIAMKKRRAKDDSGVRRFRFGVYFYQDRRAGSPVGDGESEQEKALMSQGPSPDGGASPLDDRASEAQALSDNTRPSAAAGTPPSRNGETST